MTAAALDYRTLLQWGHDKGVVEGGGRGRNGGADDQLQWGHDKGVVEGRRCAEAPDPRGGASMGPRQRSRGRPLDQFGVKILWELQWGHDKGVVEGHGTRARLEHSSGASMGPRQRSRGRPFRPANSSWHTSRFNGATTKESWKAVSGGSASTGNSSFNGATTKESWKARINAYRPIGIENASMGPRQRSRGRRSEQRASNC